MFIDLREEGEYINSIKNGLDVAIEERMKSERFQTELITNVSHDIKTPLTSIINYVDLLGKEDLKNDKAKEYLEVLQASVPEIKEAFTGSFGCFQSIHGKCGASHGKGRCRRAFKSDSW